MLPKADVKREDATSPPIQDPRIDEVLDLQGLCERCMGNLDLVERVLDKFDKRLPDELAELERVIELGDAANTALVAHRIKGNSSNVSASGLQQAAADIEDLSRLGRMADTQVPLRNLHEQWQRYVACRPLIRPSAKASAGHVSSPNFPAAR